MRADPAVAGRLGALIVGPAPICHGSSGGPLEGTEAVVKDLIDLAGLPTGAGNPQFLAEASPAARTAPAVARLVDAGVDVVGKSHTDELAFSLSGTNVHYGTPLNPSAPGRIPGGSSSGSASAVAGGLVDLGVGTDTAGSIRVPASYCGVWGFRPTWGRVPLEGVVELARSFGTVGLLAADGGLLSRAGRVLVDTEPEGAAAPVGSLVIWDEPFQLADPLVRQALMEAVSFLCERLGLSHRRLGTKESLLANWLTAFRGAQMAEAWARHGEWIRRSHPKLGPGVAARFEAASRVSAPEAQRMAQLARTELFGFVGEALGPGEVLVVPSAPTVAPPADLGSEPKEDLRTRTLAICCKTGETKEALR